MRKPVSSIPLLALICVLLTISCKKASTENAQLNNKVPESIAIQVQKLGFDTAGILKKENGYVVEKDIFLSEDQIKHGFAQNSTLRVGKTEQYRSTNLVTGLPRVITVMPQSLTSAQVQALDQAIGRYNNLRFGLTFSRVATGGQITVTGYSAADGLLGYSGLGPNDYVNGFPSSSGNPASNIHINTLYTSSLPVATVAFVLQHEMGHAIGMRHTDWQNVSYSCGSGGSEPTSGGAVHIPGSPTGADQESWMLACMGSVSNRTFSPNDAFALAYLYNPAGSGLPGSQPIWEYYNSANTDNVVTLNGNYQNFYAGWTYVASTFRAFMTSGTGRRPIYEYYNSSQHDHTYSPTPNDPNIIGFPGWSMVGLAFYVYTSNVAGSITVYRYYNASQTRTLFTSTPNIHTLYPGWTAPQVAWYAPQ